MLPLHGSQSVSLSLPHSLSVSWLLSCEISYIVISNGVRGRLTSPRLASSRRRPRTHAINLRNTGWQHFLFSLFAFAIYPRFEFNFQVTPKRGHNGCPPVCVCVCRVVCVSPSKDVLALAPGLVLVLGLLQAACALR